MASWFIDRNSILHRQDIPHHCQTAGCIAGHLAINDHVTPIYGRSAREYGKDVLQGTNIDLVRNLFDPWNWTGPIWQELDPTKLPDVIIAIDRFIEASKNENKSGS